VDIDSCKVVRRARQYTYVRASVMYRHDTCTDRDALIVQHDVGDHGGETVAAKRISEYRRHYGIAVRHVYFIGRIRQRRYYLSQIMQRKIYVTSLGQRSLSDFRLPNTFGPVMTEKDDFFFLDTRSHFHTSFAILRLRPRARFTNRMFRATYYYSLSRRAFRAYSYVGDLVLVHSTFVNII